MTDTDRMEIKLFGAVLGTASGWDEAGDATDVQFYDVKLSKIGEAFFGTSDALDVLVCFIVDGIFEVYQVYQDGGDYRLTPNWSVLDNHSAYQ